jgi:multiple sugar transport system substrate-binding protein
MISPNPAWKDYPVARFRTLASVAILLAALTACSGKAKTDDDPDAQVTLSYAVWDATQVPAMKQLAAAFTRKNPNITIDVQLTAWETYWTKLQAAATGGAAPDVFWMNGPNFQLYATNGVLAPLDQDIKADGVDLGNYPKSLVDLYNVGGRQYGLPKDFDTVGLWYNKALFDAAKVKYPDATWTWADFTAAATKLTDKAKGQYAIAANLSSGQEYTYDTIAQAGGYVVSPDGKSSGYGDAATIQGLTFWTDLIAAGESPDLKTMTDTAPINLFEAGKTAMYYGGSWDAAEFTRNDYTRSKVDVSVLPKGVKQATIIHGLANVISAKSGHPAPAWKFVDFLGSKDAADILGQAGVIPAYNGTQQAWVAAHPEMHLQAFLDELPYAVPLPVSKNTAAWNELETKYLTPVWNQKADVTTAAQQLATAMNASLAKG